ncbi:hypothetical protein C8R45DRAFT_996705 [Mycena sanguinolenta]|nr:hypothetical protein C8R45DRAFT_996705 [Mycena sanguinolenta]
MRRLFFRTFLVLSSQETTALRCSFECLCIQPSPPRYAAAAPSGRLQAARLQAAKRAQPRDAEQQRHASQSEWRVDCVAATTTTGTRTSAVSARRGMTASASASAATRSNSLGMHCRF